MTDWLTSSLQNRKQFIRYSNTSTKQETIKCGVPQGSILGPLLFLIYVNDLPNASLVLAPIMYADDTNLFFSHKNLKQIFLTVNKELKNIHEWFIANKLSLNTKKLNIHFFTQHRKLIIYHFACKS